MNTYIKHCLLAVLTVTSTSSAFARWVTQEEVRQAATVTLSRSFSKGILSDATIDSVVEMDGLWCVNLTPKGHIVFSGSTLQVPVLSFSEGAYTTPQKRSPAFAIESIQRSRAKALEAANKPDEAAEARWDALLKPVASVKMLTVVEEEEEEDEELPLEVEAILDTHWDQCLPWNDFCPQVSAESNAEDSYKNRAPVGCAVTMYSQLTNYFQWPARLDDVYTNTLIGENCALNPEGAAKYEMRFNGAIPIEWNTLDSKYEGEVSEVERLAMGRVGLLFDILSNMSFGTAESGGSGTSLLAIGENDWYDFGQACARDEDENGNLNNFTEEEIENIKGNIANGLPIPTMLSLPDGGAHGVLICGYKDVNGMTYLWINYGWGWSEEDNSNTFYEANTSGIETWLLAHTPKMQVQVAPLPKVINAANLPSVMWMVPECYEEDSENPEGDFSGFTVIATSYSSSQTSNYTPSTKSLEDPIAKTEVYETVFLEEQQVTALAVKEADGDSPTAYYHFPEAFIPTEKTAFTCDLMDLRTPEVRDKTDVTKVKVQLWSETTRSWQTLETFPKNNTDDLPDSLTISLSDAVEAFCRLRLAVIFDEDEESEEEGEEEDEESEAALCYALYNLQLCDVYAQETSVSKNLNSSKRAYSLNGLTASEGKGTRYRIQVKAKATDSETAIAPAETFTRVTTDPVVFPLITKVENLAKDEDLIDGTLLEADLDGLAGLRVTCNEAVTELCAQTSCPTLIPDNAITIYRYDEHIFDVVINSPQQLKRLDGSRMILWLEAKTAQGNVTTKEIVLALRASTASIDYTKPFIEWDVDEDTLEIPHYWFRNVGLVTDENTPESAASWKTLAENDADNDGLLNWQEYLCGTSPTNAEEKLQIQGLTFDDNGTLSSISYTPTSSEIGSITLEGKTSLTDKTWATADLTTHRFFRLRVTKK